MRTTGNNVFILPDWDKEERVGTIFLPQVRQRKLPNSGTVKFLNPNVSNEFKIGDRVIYDRHRQELQKINGEHLSLVKAENVMAIIG